jgi:hypothetical protein
MYIYLCRSNAADCVLDHIALHSRMTVDTNELERMLKEVIVT